MDIGIPQGIVGIEDQIQTAAARFANHRHRAYRRSAPRAIRRDRTATQAFRPCRGVRQLRPTPAFDSIIGASTLLSVLVRVLAYEDRGWLCPLLKADWLKLDWLKRPAAVIRLFIAFILVRFNCGWQSVGQRGLFD